MLVSAPAAAALDALLASLAPALMGEGSKASATPGFKNVLDDLTLPSDAELGGNAGQESAATPDPTSKKQQPQGPGALTAFSAATQTAAIALPQAPIALPSAGSSALPGQSTEPDATPSQTQADDSAPAQTLDNQPVTIAVAPQTTPLESSQTAPIHGRPMDPTARIAALGQPQPSSAAISSAAPPRGKLSPKAVSAGNSPVKVSAHPGYEPATVQPASQSNVRPESALASQPVTTAAATNNEQPSVPPVAAAPAQTAVDASTTNPAPPVSSAQQRGNATVSVAPALDAEKSNRMGQIQTAEVKPRAIATAPSAKSFEPAAQNAPILSRHFIPASIAPTANPLAAPAIVPRPAPASPGPASHDVASANMNRIATPTMSPEPATAPAPQPQGKTYTSDSSAPARPTPQLRTRESSVTAPSVTAENLPAPASATPTAEQPPLEQTSIPASSSPAVSPNLNQAPEIMTPTHTTSSQPSIDRTNKPAAPLVPQNEAASSTAKNPLAPRAENFSFGMRLFGLEGDASPLTDSGAAPTNDEPQLTLARQATPQTQAPQAQASASQQTAAPQAQNANPTTHETQPAAPPAGKTEPVVQSQPDNSAAPPKPTQPSHPGDTPVFEFSQQAAHQASQMEPPTSGAERGEAAEPHALLASQETHLGAPDLPKSSATSEILLHLPGDGQSTAAVRVSDRAGSVNVSVHASDPVVRESLKTNLGDLSAQLNTQGWKTEVTKSAPLAGHFDNPQDSHTGGEHGSGQQGSGEGRQPQRERRGNGGQWRQTFDQQVTGNETYPGGNR